MPVWIPWLKVNQQGGKGGGTPILLGKGWTPTWSAAKGSGSSGGGETKGKGGGSAGGGGGASGGSGGCGSYTPRKAPQAIPETFTINVDARYTGTVKLYKKFSGFGFIDLAQKGVVPGDAVYVNWRSIQTEDRFPQLVPGLEVEFGIMKVKDRNSGVWTLKSKNVTMPGGNFIAVQDELDAQYKQFVGGQHLRYTGQLQFFSAKRGFGWLQMDDGYALTEPVPKELRVDLPEVNAGGKQPPGMKDIAVEFGIMKGKRGDYKAYNMTLPGGIPMTQEGLEHRVVLGTRTFQGIVEMYNWRRGWGFIKGAPGVAFPPNVVAKIKQMQEESAKRGKATVGQDLMLYFRKEDLNFGAQVDKGQQVTFKVYTDDKGAGACEVH